MSRQATLHTLLADASRWPRSGMVLSAAAEASDGGLARCRLIIQPWLATAAPSAQ